MKTGERLAAQRVNVIDMVLNTCLHIEGGGDLVELFDLGELNS